MKCFYHDDLDGRAAAFCVYAWVGIKGLGTSFLLDHTSDGVAVRQSGLSHGVSFIPTDYGKPIPWDDIQTEEQIWIVDFSFKPADMDRLLTITKDVTWIDHHKTAMDALKGFDVRGVRRIGESGCELAWKYIHWYTARGDGPESFEPTENRQTIAMPTVIRVVGDWDTWRHEKLSKDEQETVLNFVSASKARDTTPSSNFWWACMDQDIQPLPLPNTGNAEAHKQGVAFWAKLMDEGRLIRRYDDMRNAEMRKEIGFASYIDGHTCFAMNKARTNSLAMGGDDMLARYEILMPFYFNGKTFTVSLDSKTVNVSEIAKARGGGGHKGAAGFQCEDVA